MKKKKLFCICGETCCGKDSLVRDLIEKNPEKFKAVCSYTSRPKRTTEVEGREHYFLSKEEFTKLKEERKDDIIAYTEIVGLNKSDQKYFDQDGWYGGYEYMALSDELETSNIYIIDPNGIKFLEEKNLKDTEIVIICIYTPLHQRDLRALRGRSDYAKEFDKRVFSERKQFEEFYSSHKYDYLLFNLDDNYDNAYNNLLGILNNELNK